MTGLLVRRELSLIIRGWDTLFLTISNELGNHVSHDHVSFFFLQVIFLMNSGSEANDLAMLMARAHSNNTDIISFR